MTIKHKLDDYLKFAQEQDASDIHFKSNEPAYFRLANGLRRADEVLHEADIFALLEPMMARSKERIMLQYEEYGSADFSYESGIFGEDKVRYRVQIFKSSGRISTAIRRIRPEIPTFEDIKLPEIYQQAITLRPKGIIIIGGETGSGKSTTLAAMVDYINTHQTKHIVTIEDPIEYVFKSKKSLVNQRELGDDYSGFAQSLKAVVREDPDIILIGEMRDTDTVRSAVSAAETGHLVLTTLHTATAPSTLDRILNFFPEEEKSGIRSNLSNNLIAIMNQMLVPTLDTKGRLPVTEVLINNPAIRLCILDEKKQHGMGDIIIEGADGMHSFNQSLCKYIQQELICHSVAYDNSPNSENLRTMVKGIH